MKAFQAFVLLLGIVSIGVAQPNPDTLWTRTYGGSNDDVGTIVIQTADGGYLIAGATHQVNNSHPTDIYVVKTNGQGIQQWTQTYVGAGDGNDVPWSIQQTLDGGYVIAGYTWMSYWQDDFYVIKTDGQGNPQWTRQYGGGDYDGAYSIQQTADSGYVIAGNTRSFGAGGDDCYVVKTNAQGDPVWTHTYGGSANEYAYSVRQTANGGYVIAGYTSSFGAGNNDFYVVKTNGDGDTLWTRTYGGSGDDVAQSIQPTTDGGYVVAGYTNSFGAGGYDFYVLKITAQGDTLWTRTYGGSSNDGQDGMVSIRQTLDGGYVVAGTTSSFGAGGEDFYVVKIDGQGNPLWTRTYGGSGNDVAQSIQQTTDGGYAISGYTAFGAGGWDYYLVKTGSDPCFPYRPLVPQVVIQTAGNDVHLSWNRVTQSVGGCPIAVTRYLVFSSEMETGPYWYHGSTADTTYTHVEAVRWASGMFYHLVASDAPESVLETIVRGETMEAVTAKLNARMGD